MNLFKGEAFLVILMVGQHCFVILQAAIYALEDGGISVGRVKHKHLIAALSTVKPSLTTEQLEQFKRIQK